jgi:hypothetical protein
MLTFEIVCRHLDVVAIVDPAAVGTSTHQDCAGYKVADQGFTHHLQERVSAKINLESHKFGDLEQLDRPTPPTIHQKRNEHRERCGRIRCVPRRPIPMDWSKWLRLSN